MTLLWCILGIMIALGIARYHQSNRLFWILAISFLIGIAGASIYNKMSYGGNQSKEQLTQVCPTQGTDILVSIADRIKPTSVTAQCLEPAHVSQDYTPDFSEPSSTLSKCVIPIYTPPPQLVTLIDTS